MRFDDFSIEDLFTRCMDCDDMTLEMEQEEFAALRLKIAELRVTANSPVIPAGWKLVPVEPTADMSHEGHDYYQKSKAEFGDFTPTGMYRAMLATAPQPPVSASGWIKCSDRMPEIMKTVIVAEGEYISYMWWNGEAWDCWDDHGELQDVTHWMPLPAAPKPEGE